MAYSEDHIALAAEYALGTLDAEERTQVEAMMSVDKDYAALVEAWERKLGVLNQMVGLVEPRPEVWEKIRAAIGLAGAQQALVLPDAPQQATADVVDEKASAESADALAANDANVLIFARQVRRWRNIATGMTAMAAALVTMIAVQAYRPDLLPQGLRPKVTQQVAQVQPPAAPATAVAQAQYVALLQTDASSPAFILTVDATTKSFTVRRVGAEQQPGKDYELWIVSDKLPAPRSLGVIGSSDFTTAAALAAYDPAMVSQATYAVTVEPVGGSPTGKATGPIVFTGKLIETVPPAK
ncbi:anti-sigma factor [Rhodopseudomonas sp. P2A-2r]|uniref:anti-sigma factor n=1 Tax=Rhodopseudomonas sp. P2A-2r TaxID=2991972 RepID=UPI002234CF9E|nr:anti-sigma factor [Rhodopseudomonas sp. P2A-2r]UZE52101.1 anti-sigma factor [Rhodopseudomonas sp. P2A-2r]